MLRRYAIKMRLIMTFNEIWTGVFCSKCGKPLLVFTETAWKNMSASINQSKLRDGANFQVLCSDKDCSVEASYPMEQFEYFRVEQLP
jgi:hypothetical protein